MSKKLARSQLVTYSTWCEQTVNDSSLTLHHPSCNVVVVVSRVRKGQRCFYDVIYTARSRRDFHLESPIVTASGVLCHPSGTASAWRTGSERICSFIAKQREFDGSCCGTQHTVWFLFLNWIAYYVLTTITVQFANTHYWSCSFIPVH